MQALLYKGIKQLDFCSVEKPVAQDDEVLVRVESVGICGSDMHAYLGHDPRRPAPLILGHEVAGHAEGGVLDGQRVTVNPLRTCGQCTNCRTGHENICSHRAILSMPPREGAFAEYICTPKNLLVPVPDDISLDDACLVEPLACGWHAVKLASRVYPLEQAHGLVIGGGAIGVASALALRAQGAQRITIVETNEKRHPALKSLGDFDILRSAEHINADDGKAHIVIDAVGYEATRALACAHTASGGVIAHIGLGDANEGLDIRHMTLQEITFIGCYTYTNEDFIETAKALFEGKLGIIHWTEKRALADGHQAFKDILAGQATYPKIILNP